MSELKNVGVLVRSLKIPQQTHDNLITLFDIHNDPNKMQLALKDNRFDLLGFLPKGFDFKYETTIEKIVATFNTNPQKIAFLVCPPVFNEGCPYFINKKILRLDRSIQSLSEMLLLVEEAGLESREATEELFIYGC